MAREELAQSIDSDMLTFMVGQFVSFSTGRMKDDEDKALRTEMGAWPEKYWKFFPQSVRILVADFLKGRIDETNFNNSLSLTLQVLQTSDPSRRAEQETIRPYGSFSCLLNKC